MPQLGRPKFDRVSAPEVEHGLVRPIRYVENRGSAQSPLVGNGLISTSTVSTSCLPPNWSGLQPIFPWATSLGSEAWGSVNSWDQWPKARGDETGNYRTYRPVFFVGVGELGRPWPAMATQELQMLFGMEKRWSWNRNLIRSPGSLRCFRPWRMRPAFWWQPDTTWSWIHRPRRRGVAHGVCMTPPKTPPQKSPRIPKNAFWRRSMYVYVTCHKLFILFHIKSTSFFRNGDPKWLATSKRGPHHIQRNSQEFFRPSACGLEPELVELPGKECVHLSKAMAAGLLVALIPQRQLDLRIEFQQKQMTPETSPHKISLFLLDSWANCFFWGGTSQLRQPWKAGAYSK